MLLTLEEYQRGLVRWTPNSVRSVKTATSSMPHEELHFSKELTDSQGTIPRTASAPRRELEFEFGPRNDFSDPCRISWDRLLDDDIDTLYFDASDGEFRLLDGVPSLGPFKRILVSTPYLEWTEDWVIRVQEVVILFHKQHHPRSRAHQDFCAIEVIVPEPFHLSYEPTFSVLGLIALHFGDAAIGTVETNESRKFNTNIGATERSITLQGVGSKIPSSVSQTLRLPIVIPETKFQDLNDDLQAITRAGKVTTSIQLGLRWYEQSIRSFSETDRLLSSVVGIEAVITRVSVEEGFRSPIADIVKDPRIQAILETLVSMYGEEKVDRLKKRLTNVNPSILDRYEHFCAINNWSAQDHTELRDVSELRNQLVHGSTTTISRSDAMDASHLLAKVLKAAIAWHRN
ncbi:MAG: hypothetical protein WKF63_09830 [Thermomicrobiales bacterium]